jgi:Proteasome subunit
MRVRVSIALSVIATVLPIVGTSQLPTRTATPRESPTSTHGTINLLLANKNGTVLITDSRISNGNYQRISDHAQKLFQLDDKTVCSIANFYSDPGPDRFQQATPDRRPVLFQSIDGLIRTGRFFKKPMLLRNI